MMLIAALMLNLLILVPLVVSLVGQSTGMEAAFGQTTDARRILTCVYGAIAALSAALIWLHLASHSWAVPMTVTLFAVQITYKLATVPMVGLGSPVVMTNLLVVAVQVVVLVALALRGSGAG
ncbi:MAG: hypothetical protein AAFP87_15340 [Pseudomonadota bacterium]